MPFLCRCYSMLKLPLSFAMHFRVFCSKPAIHHLIWWQQHASPDLGSSGPRSDTSTPHFHTLTVPKESIEIYKCLLDSDSTWNCYSLSFISQKTLYLLSLHGFGPRIVGLLVPIFQLASSNPAWYPNSRFSILPSMRSRIIWLDLNRLLTFQSFFLVRWRLCRTILDRDARLRESG